PKSDSCGPNTGPTSQFPVLMSKRQVVALLLTAGSKPPTTYRNWPIWWYPARKKEAGAAVPADHVLLAMSYTSTWADPPPNMNPPATNTLPLNAPDAEP